MTIAIGLMLLRLPATGRWTFDAAFQGGGFGVGTDVDLHGDFYADRHVGDHFDRRLGYATLHGRAIGFGIVL
jgi:hypothetical protein